MLGEAKSPNKGSLEEKGKANFWVLLPSSTTSSKGAHLAKAKSWVWVRTETLDGLVFKLGALEGGLKMNVKGEEVEVLREGKRTLGITRKIAVAAYHRWKGEQTWPRVRRCCSGPGSARR
jgi:hypothetical protein